MNAEKLAEDIEPILEFGLPLHDLGWSISPPVPPKGKHPILTWKPYQIERATKRQLIDWAEEFPYFNYGVITGSVSGIICLDADNPDAEAVISKHCPPTPMRQKSGSGRGQHFIYRHPGSNVLTRKNLVVHGEEIKGLDIRGDGGLFIGPGSIHYRTQAPYMMIEPWTKEMLASLPVFDPGWLGLSAEPPRPPATETRSPVCSNIPLTRKQEFAREFLADKAGTKEGEGKAENRCFALASALVHGFDLTPDEAEDLLLEWGEQESNTDEHGNYQPWKRSEIRHKLDDAAKQEDPEGRSRGYLLPEFDYKELETVFARTKSRQRKTKVTFPELEQEIPGADVNLIPMFPVAAETKSAETDLTPLILDEGDPAHRFADDARTAYLWQRNHARASNVKPHERLQRAKSVVEAYSLIPKSGLLPDFLATYLPTTDCSCTLLLGAGLALSASFLNRRVWIVQGQLRVYPHLWCGLIAASGERKSTSVNIVAKLLKADPQYADICLSSDSTWPAVAARLGIGVNTGEDGQPDWTAAREACAVKPVSWLKGVGTLCIDELAAWLKMLNSNVNQGMRETMTGMYESPPEITKETKTAGSYYIWRPCLTIVAASTDTWLAENSSESDLKGGFLGRWLFFVSSGPDYRLHRCDVPREESRRCLLMGIEHLKSVSGEVTVSEQAWDEYCNWAKELTVSERLEAFRSRLENAVLKVALIYAVSQGEMIVEAETMRLAIAMVNWLAAQAETFAAEKLVFEPVQKNIVKLRKVLAVRGELGRSELLRLSRLTSRQLDEALTTMLQSEEVVEIKVPGKGRTGSAYRLIDGELSLAAK